MTDATHTRPDARQAGRFTFPGTDISVNRMGYGAMQLAGPHVFGPPADEDAARAVLKEAVACGVDHIDTSDFYGPYVVNRLIDEALRPYPEALTLVTKVGAFRDEKGGWPLDRSPEGLTRAVHDNLDHLGIDRIDVVNLRMGGPEDDVIEPLGVLKRFQDEGRIAHIGLSNVTAAQVRAGQSVVPIVCVQNQYNVVFRGDDALIDSLADEGIAYVPFFPLGGFTPIQSAGLDGVARDLGVSAQQVALAWLLQRSPNVLVIPGTSSVAHLHDNIAAAALSLPDDALTTLNGLATAG
ncbi:oxidoreductase [Acuticoccus sediminis]|uniref:Oxidoreductase n=1 Tax=Acuticoccus sediminis TaxID=2184697 RepID=A0A8B2NMB3_9HYPH|nr:oxidoreductase [Acuticoccus sediminis]RAH99770.1 oxidoreductase [Acuticoccus sediminis]